MTNITNNETHIRKLIYDWAQALDVSTDKLLK